MTKTLRINFEFVVKFLTQFYILNVKVKVKVKIKFTLEQTTKVQRDNRGIALLFL